MRRKRHEEHLNHEAWAIPYADLMTLLLAFFVVMYAVSVVNVGKYRVMSESMMNAFNGHPGAIVPLSAQKSSQAAEPSVPVTRNAPVAVVKMPLPLRGVTAASAAAQPAPTAVQPPPQPNTLMRIEDLVRQAMQPLIDKKLVVLRRTPDRLEIEIRTDILFTSGEAKLSASASQALVSVASILSPFPNALRVEGFTDNIPISTAVYPSNWELSAARAASVARLFADHGVLPGRLGIVGWGDVRPIADNATSDGRNHNRRVLVVVEGDHNGDTRVQGDTDQMDLSQALSKVTTAPSSPTGAPTSSPAAAPPAQTSPSRTPAKASTPQAMPAASELQPSGSTADSRRAGGDGRDVPAGRKP